MRSALHKATRDKGNKGLTHGDLSRNVFDAMQLRFDEYAADPEVRGPARNATHDALRRVIDYYLYRDLQRGWRVTAPNLEDCGLLAFDYDGPWQRGLLGELNSGRRLHVKTDRDAEQDPSPRRAPCRVARGDSAHITDVCAGPSRSRSMLDPRDSWIWLSKPSCEFRGYCPVSRGCPRTR